MSGDAEDKAVRLLHEVLLGRKPRRPSSNDWVSIEPVLDFLMLGQVGGVLAQLFKVAHQRLAPSAEEGWEPVDISVAEDHVLAVSWHSVAGARYRRSLKVITDPNEQFLQRAMSIVLEPFRWLASWFTQAAHGLRSSQAVVAAVTTL